MADTTRPPGPDKQNSAVSIGDIEGGIHDTIIAGRDVYIQVQIAARDEQFRRNRSQMLEKVRLIWIKGLLEPSLYHLTRIELGLETKPDAVTRPFDLLVQRPKQAPQPLPIGTPISQIFTDSGNALLILGEPGAGKTTLLLELARALLDRAKQDERHLIPVVFTLSSWAEQRLALADWLIDELNKRYDVPRTLAKTWGDAELILPLLDGLDEVAADYRDACVETINAFLHEHGLLPVVVCSRVADYEALSVPLRLPRAVLIQSLSRQQVQNYVEQAGASLAGLRTVLQEDETLWEILNTPLMLSIMALAYQGCSAEEIHATGTLEERRPHVFAAYTDAMFHRRTQATPYTREQTERWLAWLARAMKGRNQSIFYLEWMQADWLLIRRQQRLVTVISSIMTGILGGLSVGLLSGLVNGLFSGLTSGVGYGVIFGLSVGRRHPFIVGPLAGLGIGLVGGLGFGLVSGLRSGLFIGLLFGLIYGVLGGLVGRLVGYSREIQPVERLRWSWSAAQDKWMSKLLKRLLGGLVFYLLAALIAYLGFGRGSVLSGGLYLGLVYVLFRGLFDGFTIGEIGTYTFPNEGIRRSLRNALISGFGVGLLGGLASPLVGGPSVGLGIGLLGGLLVGLRFGGRASLHHFALRLVLWHNHCAPLDYVHFLNYATARIFLRKVGGGYVFVHRMLLEYFAALHPTSTDQQNCNTNG